MMAKIGALAIVALILVVAVPVASAGPFEEARDRWLDAKAEFLRAYAAWLDARADWIEARRQWRLSRTPANLAIVVEKAKAALLQWDAVVVWGLTMLKYRVEATRGLSDNEKASLTAELDNYISVLQGYPSRIQVIDNAQEIRSIATEMWNYWLSIRVRVKQITAQVIVAWAKGLLYRAEAFAGRVEARIEQLKDNGVDTSALENWLADFNSKIELAREKISAAENKVSQITDQTTFFDIFWATASFIRSTASYLREAFRDLRNIISDMRSKGHTVTLSGTGTLIANGSGSAYIAGTGIVRIIAVENSIMIVSANAKVGTDGRGTKTTLPDNRIQYEGFGWARVVGTDITVEITGNNISLHAHGTGSATLTGTGTYRTYGENRYVDGTWTAAGVTANLATGEASAG